MNSAIRIKYPIPDLPAEEWSDIRAEFERTHSLLQVSKTFMCDPRTVGRCLRLNLSSAELGRQVTPKKLDFYRRVIHQRLEEICFEESNGNRHSGICQISRTITTELKAKGYTGSERTVRNYIRMYYRIIRKEEDPL